MNVEEIYKNANAYLQGHFKLSSGKHSAYYLQSAKVLEDPKTAQMLAEALATQITTAGITVDTVCSPALGGVLAGYELARALHARFIFTERVEGIMSLRRGFEVHKGEKILICEDIITTGGSALESASCVEGLGASIVAFAALANRGFCTRSNTGTDSHKSSTCKLPATTPFFALDDFEFEIYEPTTCPLCQTGSTAIKPGSRGN
jgi:orotate phosphoribosyltransferase